MADTAPEMGAFFMAKVISTLDDAITYINALYESDETAPTSGDEDYTVWTNLINLAINLWESEEGMLWFELFIKLVDSADGDKTTDGTNSYTLPALFQFPASAYVWIGSGQNKTPYKVIKPQELQLYENNGGNWCYFTTTTLEFNPNLTMSTGQTISYNFYKYATKLTTGSSAFEMSDPMAAVYYAVGELKKDEGDSSSLQVFSQKIEGMKTKNIMPTWYQNENNLENSDDEGMGI